jgi:hypothetical protein
MSAQRRYGYYVLPFLWRDRIVGRADLKSERPRDRLSSRRSTWSRVCAARERLTRHSTGLSTGSGAPQGLERVVR